MKNIKKLVVIGLLFIQQFTIAQATLTEEIRELDTYGFSNPNPVPNLTKNTRIFPYFNFEGYSHTSKKKPWKVVKLENDYIKVYILPEMGGKVWGAIEKSTGNEFLYRNEVVKFRNLAMRGPWTSGGIEFNFGLIGHHPSTATPVDYTTKKHQDGSVSCVVGNYDLPSRTFWQVEIKLGKDKAYFETKASWYNGTPINQAYYNWMTGAAPASNDLEFFVPGNGSLAHDGILKEWPIDKKGRNLAMYKNNNFGPAKSYHIVGSYENYFGGYYHDKKVGFGRAAPYEEMPGRKLWIWSVSRAGAIWENLLTDTDGQYIEFQAGRLHNQYFSGKENPISQTYFEPYLMDSWREIWFPVKQIGGIESVSEYGVLNVERNGNKSYIGINALQPFNEKIQIIINGKEVINEELKMRTMDVFEKIITCKDSDKLEIYVGNQKLRYNSKKKIEFLKRPFKYNPNIKVSKVEKLYHEAEEAQEYREYKKAEEKLAELFKIDAAHSRALVLMADLEYRKTNYDKAIEYANKALQIDTYDHAANYIVGISYWAKRDMLNALESLGWAARSIKYRSAAYAQMAEIYLAKNELYRANDYAKRALSFNTYNMNARQVLLILNRKIGNKEALKNQLDKIFEITLLNHFAMYEKLKLDDNSEAILNHIQNEHKHETILELAILYLNLGETEDALQLLKLNKKDTKSKLLLAYLSKDKNPKASKIYLNTLTKISPRFVFPYRREMLPALKWAKASNDNWKYKYYLAQNYLAVGLEDKAKKLLKTCDDIPDDDAFYIFRAELFKESSFENKLKDYSKALALNNQYWKNWDDFILFYLGNNQPKKAYVLAKKGIKKFPKNYSIGLSYSKALVRTRRYSKAITRLNNLNLLPYEHARESKKVFDKAHIYLAKNYMDKQEYESAIKLLEDSKVWKENLGIGKPYNPDERPANYLLALCYKNNPNKMKSYLKSVATFSTEETKYPTYGVNFIFSLHAMKTLGMEKKQQELLEKFKKAPKTNQSAQIVLALHNKNIEKAKFLMMKLKQIDEEMMKILLSL